MSRSFWAKTVTAMLIVAGSAVVSPATSAAATGPIRTQAFSAQAAFTAARQSGQPVEVLGAKSATTRIWALPNGSSRAEVAGAPVRLHRDGRWQDFDMTLVRRADGSVAPRVHPDGLVFSGAVFSGASGSGERDLATIQVDGERVGLGWAGPLPEPALSGDKATYAEVMPGVDLVLQARSGGFEQFFVARDRAAAARVAGFTVPMRNGKLTFAATGNGAGQWQRADGRVVARMPQAMMWDAQGVGADGIARRQAKVGVALEGERAARARLSPDLAWLNDPATRYPVTIDPGIQLERAAGFDEFVQNTIDISDNQSSAELRLGYADSQDCLNAGGSQACRARSYLRFDGLSSFRGAKLYSASVRLWAFHSWSCNAFGWYATRTDPVGGWVQWGNEPAHAAEVGAVSNETRGYSGSCDDNWVNADAVPIVRVAFDNGWDSVSMVLRAVGDSGSGWSVTNHNSWKKFDSMEGAHPPRIVFEYNHIPTVSNTSVEFDGVCGSGVFRKYLTTATPTFRAQVVDDDRGPGIPSFNVKLELRVVRQDNGTAVTKLSGEGAPGSMIAVSLDAALLTTKTYTWQVRPLDLYGDGSVMDYGEWSPPCEIGFDAAAISFPPIVEGIPTEEVDGETYRMLHYGQPVTLTFRPQPVDLPKVAGYRWGFSQEAAAAPNAPTVWAGADGSARAVVVNWAVDGQGAPLGEVALHVRAITVTGNSTETSHFRDEHLFNLNLEVPETPVRVAGDLHGDGRADLNGFRDISANSSYLYSYPGSGDGGLIDPARIIEVQYSSANAQTVRGDFDGNGRTDYAALVSVASNNVVVKALRSDGNAVTEAERWSSSLAGAPHAGNWPWGSFKLLAGDANFDGRDDLIVAKASGTTSWMLKVFLAQDVPGAIGFAPPVDWLAAPVSGDLAKAKLVAGRFDRAFGVDVAEFRDLGTCRTVLRSYLNTGTAFAAGVQVWDSAQFAEGWCWDKSQFVAGDYEGTATGTPAGVVATYDRGGCRTELYTFTPTYIGTNGMDHYRWVGHILQWDPGVGPKDWCANQMQLSMSDLSGDGRSDLVVSYQCCGPHQQRVWVFAATGHVMTYFRPGAYRTGTDIWVEPLLKWQGALGPAAIGSVRFDTTTRYQLVAKHSSYCASVFDGSTGGSLLEHTPVKQQQCAVGLLNGQYTLEPRGASDVRLHPVYEPIKCLNVEGASTTTGASVIASTCSYDGQTNESFRIEYVNGMQTTPYHPNELSVRVVNRNSGQCLDVAGASYAEGARIMQNTCIPQHPNQTFFLRAVPAPADGLLAKWRMYSPGFYDPQLIDWSNRQVVATINDVQTTTNNQDFGYLILNGTTGYARTGGPVIETKKSFTVSAWVKLDVVGGRFQTAVAQEGPWASAFYLQNTSDGRWRLVLMNNIASSTPVEASAWASSASTAGVWVHAVGVYDAASATGLLYLDGQWAGQSPVPGGVSTSGPLVMGSAIWGTVRGDYLDGTIDDVRAWDRALSAAEIAALHAAGRS